MAELPVRIGPYEILGRLGVGGMAEAYLAVRRGPGGFVQRACIKRIRPDLGQDPEFVRQFMAEASLAARLRHAAITQVLDFGQDGNHYYLALELVEGLDLRELLEAVGGSLSPELTLYCAIELATALDFAHRGGGVPGESAIVHRDVSPSNVLVSLEGEVKLTDFGIARSLGGPRHTRTGIVRGKIPYMAPEYARTGRFDARCDLFGLGALLYECSCGERPHEGATELETLELAASGSHIALQARAPSVPEAFASIVERLLAPDPDQRFPSASALLESLLALPAPQRARRTLRTLVAEKKLQKTHAESSAPALALGPTQLMSQPVATPNLAPPTETRSAQDADGTLSGSIPGLRPHRGPLFLLTVALLLAAGVLAAAALRIAERRGASASRPPSEASQQKPSSKPNEPSEHADQPAASPSAGPAPHPRRPQPSTSQRNASLEVVVLPYGDVTVDGKHVGVAPVTLTLEPGEHAIEAKNRDGTVQKHISLTAGEHRQLILR